MTVPAPLRALAARIDARTPRERVLLFAAATTIVVLAWDVAVRAPLAERQRVAIERAASLGEEIATMRASREQLRDQIERLSGSGVDERVAELETRIDAVERELEARAVRLVSPGEMVAVLRELVAQDAGLELVALRNDEAEPIVSTREAEAAGAAVPRVFRHRVELVLRGEYFALLEYLRRIEGLEWRFRWNALNIATLDYPVAEAVIVLSTLSFAEGWIGV